MALQQDIKNNIVRDFKTNSDVYSEFQNDFNLNLFQYPSDLGADDLKHYIVFTINERGKSKLNLEGSERIAKVARAEDSAQLSEESLSTARAAALVAGGVGAGLAAATVVNSFSSAFTSKNNKTGSKKGVQIPTSAAAVGGAVFGGVAATSSEFLQPDTSYKISDVIALYVDSAPTVRYNAQYSNKDLGTLAGIIGGGASSVASVVNPTSEAGSAMALQFAKIPSIAGLGSTQDIIGASAKVALNPFKEVLFESIDFRSFSFKYRFFPKSEQESNSVFEIIKRFKFHMHPELSSNKLFFLYPSEFEIAYYFGDKQNNQSSGGYFHKFKPCILETMDITYGGDQFSSFANGYPTEINMTLTFRETEILTKKQIAEGF